MVTTSQHILAFLLVAALALIGASLTACETKDNALQCTFQAAPTTD